MELSIVLAIATPVSSSKLSEIPVSFYRFVCRGIWTEQEVPEGGGFQFLKTWFSQSAQPNHSPSWPNP